MNSCPQNRCTIALFLLTGLFLLADPARGATGDAPQAAAFFRALNLNGPALELDGHPWEGSNAPNVTIQGRRFENQSVPLRPATDPRRARMIRSSIWGDKVDVELTQVPPGDYQVFVYVWEDNHSEQFDLLLNDRPVREKFHSGSAGSWSRLGPWRASPVQGRLKVSARGPGHGAANFSGIEVWAGTGPVPAPASPSFATDPTPAQVEFFERRIRPVFADNCYECHQAGAKKIGGGLLLDSRAGVRQGGDSGPAVAPGDPESSLLLRAVRHIDASLTMPPRKKLPDEAIADLETWIRQGAPDPRTNNTVAAMLARSVIDWNKAREWWSFRPVAAPPVPSVKASEWPRNGVDAFLLHDLEQAGVTPSADADRRTLLRRATYDLTGLPPSPGEIAAFQADPAVDAAAFATVVERLLASPAYGERWGRHWLDVVRYADTAGDNSDFPIPQIHRYRDWVIRAFNRDLPYDQFVRDQLAGDLVPGATTRETHDRIIATGYLANSRRFGSRVDDYPQHLTIEDTLDNLGRAFLGLSLNCARCHDHKFDPITSADYYAIYGIFHSTRYPWPGIELEQRQRDLVPLVEPGGLAATEAARRSRDEEKRRLEKAVQDLKQSLKTAPAGEKPAVEEKIRKAEQAAREASVRPLPFEEAYAVAESARIENVPIQLKGDPARPGEVVRRRFLTVLGGTGLEAGESGSGRRQLAGWITNPGNPLTARVMVNRIWQHHFGRGLVATPNDFGRQGKPPSHPGLLDWLAQQFIESGWSVKSMHRLILQSRAYQLAGARSAAAVEQDPENLLLASFPRRRLDAEALRDTLLVLGGNLDTTPAGAHPFPPAGEWKFTQHNPFKAVYDTRRRSVYLMTQRLQRHPYLAIFDGADPSASTPQRTSSTTPLQALFLLNDAFVHEQARRFARRLLAAAIGDTDRVGLAFQEALGRLPTPAEQDQAREFLDRVRAVSGTAGSGGTNPDQDAWEALVRVILRLNEFAYLD